MTNFLFACDHPDCPTLVLEGRYAEDAIRANLDLLTLSDAEKCFITLSGESFRLLLDPNGYYFFSGKLGSIIFWLKHKRCSTKIGPLICGRRPFNLKSSTWSGP